MPDDDWALGQNEVDVRNEARMARHGRTHMSPPVESLFAADPDVHLATGPLAPDTCGCEGLCICESRPTGEDS